MTAADVSTLALQLPPSARAQLAQALLQSLENSEPDVAGWAEAVALAEVAAARTIGRAVLPSECAHACNILTKHILEEDGLLHSLRPFTRVHAEHLAELLSALRVVQERVRGGYPMLYAPLADAFCLLERVHWWALDEAGMLRRNRLIDDEQLQLLRTWHVEFSEILAWILGALAEAERSRVLSTP